MYVRIMCILTIDKSRYLAATQFLIYGLSTAVNTAASAAGLDIKIHRSVLEERCSGLRLEQLPDYTEQTTPVLFSNAYLNCTVI